MEADYGDGWVRLPSESLPGWYPGGWVGEHVAAVLRVRAAAASVAGVESPVRVRAVCAGATLATAGKRC